MLTVVSVPHKSELMVSSPDTHALCTDFSMSGKLVGRIKDSCLEAFMSCDDHILVA